MILNWFSWIIDHTLGYIFKGLFWIISHIFPSTYALVVTEFGDLFFEGIKITLGISLFGTIFGFLIACVLGMVRAIKVKESTPLALKILRLIGDYIIRIYVTIFRGTPMMVQAMIIFYGLVGIFNWEPNVAGLFIVSINTGAYLTEVIKNGIDSVDNGQMEAGRALGFSYFTTMLLVVFPQAIKNSMASIGNEFVINIKDTSVLNVIGCAEMYWVLKKSASVNYQYMGQMIVGAIVYLILTLSTTKILGLIDKKLGVQEIDNKSSN